MYTVKGNAGKIARATQGLELAGLRYTRRGIRADAVLTSGQRAKLGCVRHQGEAEAQQGGAGRQRAGRRPGGRRLRGLPILGRAGGIRDELYRVARRNPEIVKLKVLGRSVQGRELIALKVTRSARRKRDGSRPAVLYSSNQHAREWISLEVNRRLLHYFVDGWRDRDREIRRLLGRTELWFVISANPDGYQYTFDTERLWRKTLRDNDGDGQITVGDGVDPNRNFAEHWAAMTTRDRRPIRRTRPTAARAPLRNPRPRRCRA